MDSSINDQEEIITTPPRKHRKTISNPSLLNEIEIDEPKSGQSSNALCSPNFFPRKKLIQSKSNGFKPNEFCNNTDKDNKIIKRSNTWRNRFFQNNIQSAQEKNPIAIKKHIKSFIAHSFSTAGLCLFTLFYSFAGALLIGLVDRQRDEAINVTKRVENERIHHSNRLWELLLKINVFEEEQIKKELILTLEEYERFLFEVIKQDHYDENSKAIADGTSKEWPIAEALFFAITVITTIGYGHKAPKTWQGRLFTMAYALFGIPVMLLCISNLGNIMANTFRFSYRRICCCCCLDDTSSSSKRVVLVDDNALDTNTQIRKTSELSEDYIKLTLSNYDKNKINTSKNNNMETGQVNAKPINTSNGSNNSTLNTRKASRASRVVYEKHFSTTRNNTSVPIWLVFVIVSSYIFLGGYFFSLLNDQSIPNTFIGSYFCFITLSTIGFGDIVPGMLTDIDLERGTTGQSQYQLIICCAYLFFGLALIAMSFNLVQETIKNKFKRIGQRIGMIASTDL